MKSTLIAVTLALATLVLLDPTANALVHRVPLSHMRLPELKNMHGQEMDPLAHIAAHHGTDKPTLQQRFQQERAATNTSSSCSGNGGNGGATSGGAQASLSTDQGYMVVVEANIGTEAQGPFLMQVSLWDEEIYVLDPKAKYGKSGGRVHNKQTFNSSSSTTYAAQANAAFSDTWMYISGFVGDDVATIGALNANMSVQVAKKVDSYMRDVDIDGTLGLSISEKKDGSSLVEQLSSQLNSPVVTLHIDEPWYSWWDAEDAADGTGVLSFGDLAVDTCDSASWTSTGSDEAWWYPTVDVTGISRPAAEGECDSSVTANITMFPVPFFMPFFVSYQVEQLLVKASGAKWNADSWWYTVDDVSKAKPVTLQMANGASITLNPADYLLEDVDGTQILFTFGFYNQDMYADNDYVFLPQQFINNRCFSMNTNTGMWSIANSIKQTETVFVPSSSSSGSVEADNN